jgi:hypothetical protein
MTSKRVSVGEVESAREYPCQAISSSAFYKRERERRIERERDRRIERERKYHTALLLFQ